VTVRREVSDFAAFIEELGERVERLETALPTSAADENGPPQTQWLTRKQAAERIHVSLRQFDRLHKEQQRIEGQYGAGDSPLFHADDAAQATRPCSTQTTWTRWCGRSGTRRDLDERAVGDEVPADAHPGQALADSDARSHRGPARRRDRVRARRAPSTLPPLQRCRVLMAEGRDASPRYRLRRATGEARPRGARQSRARRAVSVAP
jgi:hypothetical protein